MDVPTWTKQAGAYAIKHFHRIIAYSGYRSSMADYDAEEFFLGPNAPDEAIGSAISKSLAHSRMLSIPEVRLRREKATELYNDWVKRTMERFSYKTKRAMFKDMKSCGIYQLDEHIRFNPSRHDKLEAWEDLDESEHVLVPISASAAELGASLRLAFNRCI
jgi:hypothetical protein